MQPLVLHPPSLTTAQFGQPRFNSGPERLPLNRSWSTNARGCSPRAPFRRQSMSGSPPAEEPTVTSRDLKPELGYPPVSSPAVTAVSAVTAAGAVAAPTPFPITSTATTTIPGPSSLPPSHPLVLNEPLPAHVSTPRYGDPLGPAPSAFLAGSPRLPPGAAPYVSFPGLDSSVAGPSPRSLTQKSTRRTKAHVASACVNCKKKHLGCDPARPCRRCVLAGKASSCVDVTHKKRGRPPLKAEDSSLRSYSTHADNPAVPAEVHPNAPPHRTIMHRTTSSRELRPMTDLQGLGEPGPAGASMRVPGAQSHRWSASVFPLTRPMDPSPSMPGPGGRRPFSSSGPPTYAVPAHPPPAFVPMASGFNPVIKPGNMPPGMERRFPPYGPGLPPPTSPPQPQLPGGMAYLHYAEAPSNTIHQTLTDPRMPHGPREPYLESPVRLPPIHQATASPVPGPPPHPQHAHRLSDPYPASWSSGSRDDNFREPRSPIQLQRPLGSVFSHSPTHQRSSSTTGPLDPIPRHLGPIDLPSPVSIAHSSPALTRTTINPATTEADTQEPRPIKRRKMALDDMVNG
ncbi:hypothetical protein N7462_005209 [Penicillium macrosclerotiorum]|uniref:uncharacterized protein n=1 Tax=Penicillium macrosclerotiorum TaxID=303699 RepID=UPI002547C09A|nr:uncharacterized protein N7462_005209 [Penicillium macrosclerotiorum]KAJ5690817.1 hypothetical protein N7462_005209 [Penicillium macrosclerotiorum]